MYVLCLPNATKVQNLCFLYVRIGSRSQRVEETNGILRFGTLISKISILFVKYSIKNSLHL